MAALLAHSESSAAEKLWKECYLLSMNGKPAGMYVEEVELRKKEKQIAVTQRWREKEEGETYIGSVAMDDGIYSPIAFFNERQVGAQVTKTDGRIKNGKLNVTVKGSTGEKDHRSYSLRPRTYLSNTISLLVAKKKPAKEPYLFRAIVEDVRDGSYEPRAGAALITNETKKIRGLSCRKVQVEFSGTAEWWVATDGRLCAMTNPGNGSKIELSTEAAAKKALGLP